MKELTIKEVCVVYESSLTTIRIGIRKCWFPQPTRKDKHNKNKFYWNEDVILDFLPKFKELTKAKYKTRFSKKEILETEKIKRYQKAIKGFNKIKHR